MERYKFIYVLIDPVDDLVKYVGATFYPRARYNDHLSNAKKSQNNTKKILWLKSLLELDLLPEIQIIEKVNENDWEEREEYWISYYGSDVLTNDTIGGIGNKIPSESSRNKVANKLKGRKLAPEVIERAAATHIGTSFCQGIKMGKIKGKYVGIYKNSHTSWAGQIYYHNKKYYLGSFKTEEAAARAYNKKAIELYGDKARLNIIEEK